MDPAQNFTVEVFDSVFCTLRADLGGSHFKQHDEGW